MVSVGTIPRKKRSVRSKVRKTGWVSEKSGQEVDGDISKKSGQEIDGDRKVLRSKYLEITNLIKDKRDAISDAGSEKFRTIINKVDQMHQSVKKPREQVADAEALLNLTEIISTSVKSLMNGGLKASEFISCLLRGYSTTVANGGADGASKTVVYWKDLGYDVSPVFKRFSGCTTMIGPLQMKMKQRKVAVRRPRTKRSRMSTSFPKELGLAAEGEKTDTDKNIATMFDILKNKKRVRQESLILNRTSFAQTVENLFALSFLVKDGRVEITIDENGCHMAAPKNGPSASSIQSGEAAYHHFVFRFDFQDWQMMLDYVPIGEELMPHREYMDIYPPCSSQKQSRQQHSAVGIPQKQDKGVAGEDPCVEIIQEKGKSVGRECGGFTNVWKGFGYQKVDLKTE